jgi:hypothetical protein
LTEETCPSAALSTTDPTCCPITNPGHRGGKPATNRLSYGTAFFYLAREYKLFRTVGRFRNNFIFLLYRNMHLW